MRIAYLAHLNGIDHSGVLHKIIGQVGEWRGAGHTAGIFLLTRDQPGEWESLLRPEVVGRYSSFASRMRAVQVLTQAIRGFRPSLVYYRRDVFYPQLLRLPRNAPLVVEINSNDRSEYELGSRVRSNYNAWTRGVLLRRAQGLVFVTSELRDHDDFRGFGAQRAVITNGIDLRSYPVVPAPESQQPRLVFIGTAGQPWQGIDKLVTLAAQRPSWAFDVIGMTGKGFGPTPNISWHGPLPRPEVISVMARAHVGVGTLALHRKLLNESSSLKVREYLALGLPVLYGTIDPDADILGDLALRIPNTESSVTDELPRISSFVDRAIGRRVPRSAVTHIDYREKEKQRLALFRELTAAE